MPTRDSAMVTAAATPSTTGTPVRSPTFSSSPAMPPQPRQITSACRPRRTAAGLADDGVDGAARVALQFEHGHPARPYGRAPRVQTGQLQPVLDQGHGPVQGGDDRVLVPEEHGGGRGRLGDVDDRDVQQLLQALAAVLAVAGLDDGVVRFVVGRAPCPSPRSAAR